MAASADAGSRFDPCMRQEKAFATSSIQRCSDTCGQRITRTSTFIISRPHVSGSGGHFFHAVCKTTLHAEFEKSEIIISQDRNQ